MNKKRLFSLMSILILLLIFVLSCENKTEKPIELEVKVEKPTITVGEKTKILVENINTQSLTFTSENDVLSVSADGTVTGMQAGNGRIRISHKTGVTIYVDIKVVEKAFEIASFDIKIEKNSLNVGSKTRIISTTSLEDKRFKYESMNNLVSIDDKENIVALYPGEEIIKVSHSSGYSKNINIHINDLKIEAHAEKSTITVGEKTKIIVENINTQSLTFTSENDVLSVSADGTVTGMQAGNGRIRISHKTGSTLYIDINVIEKANGEIKAENVTINVPPEGGTYTYKIQKLNKDATYTIDGQKDFFSISCENGELEDTITIKVNKNNSRLDKRATLSVKNYRNREKAKIKISQEMNFDSKITYYWLGGVNDNNSITYRKGLPGTNDLYLEVPETNNTKFYNANKISNLGPDKDMCGTYTATNLAHWFLDQNKDNIEKYKAIKNIDDPKFALNDYDYKRPDDRKSTIAEYFKNARYMRANIHDALEWLLAGKDLQTGIKGPSWFEDVLLKESKEYILIEPTATKEDLERIVFNAYEKGAILSMDYYYKREYFHAVNIWGFGIDEENNVVEFFIADSNIQDTFLYNAGIYYRDDDNQPYFYNLAVTKEKGRTNWNIMDLITLYNGRNLFDKFFQSL